MKFKTSVIFFTVLRILLLPVAVGIAGWLTAYPFGMADCHFYGSARTIDTKYVWFQCYVKAPRIGWLTKEEYERSVIGNRVMLGNE